MVKWKRKGLGFHFDTLSLDHSNIKNLISKLIRLSYIIGFDRDWTFPPYILAFRADADSRVPP